MIRKFSIPAAVFLFALLLLPTQLDARVYTGLEVFMSRHTSLVKGKRVGLVTNPTGVNAHLQATVDLLKRHPNVNLVALFAPEHGIRGNLKAGQHVPGGRDPASGLPVYSLYGGQDHRPTAAALTRIDVLIYDIQDVGSRAYTYIWHLAECMSACAQYQKTVIVLDRPNPYGANVVDGPTTERQYLSFIGLYPIPRVYGMTVGELAHYLNREERINCRLYVIPMMNFRRGMNWSQTGLPWVPTSPHIPSPEAAYCFAATGTIGEIGTINIGIGYTLPFQCVATPWINAEYSAAMLNRLQLPGVYFRPIHYKPFYGMYTGQSIHGVQIHVTNPAVFKPTTTEVAILCHLQKSYGRRLQWAPDKIKTFDKAMGTSSVRSYICRGYSYQKISASWQRSINAFKARRKKYLIYK